jgi:O-methyltransferase
MGSELVALLETAAYDNRMLGFGRLQGLASARMGLDQRSLRGRRADGSRNGTLGGYGNEQLLRSPVRRNVARSRLAQASNGGDPCCHSPRLTAKQKVVDAQSARRIRSSNVTPIQKKIHNDSRVLAVLLPIADGMTLARKL